jgi:hypothetical protein
VEILKLLDASSVVEDYEVFDVMKLGDGWYGRVDMEEASRRILKVALFSVFFSKAYMK